MERNKLVKVKINKGNIDQVKDMYEEEQVVKGESVGFRKDV